ncbi:MAG TPA: hypothetical protein PLN21_16450 [Gemmatales bacterium]|nr:hypothetical protein [Gemmatales bacterium]
MNRLRTLLFACTALTTLALSVGSSADTKLDISNWKEILPEPVYTKLVEESIKNLNSYTASASQFNQNGRRVQAEATNLLVYAEIAQRAGQSNAVGLRQAAEELLAAAKAKKGDEAKKLVASLAGYKKLTGTGGESDLAKTTSLKTIMDVSVKEIDRNLTQYKRLTSAAFAAKGKSEEVISAMYKLAALSVATTAHVPTTDIPAGKSAKDWLSAAEDMRKHSLAAAAAATAKKLPELKKAVNDLSAACTKCHEDFRVEKN